ncbi:MAG: DUF2169 family type VI secretion system accessory protein, partial [Casimicrobium sp.]
LLVRLNAGPMLFMPMNIDTVIIDFASGTLTIVRRALISSENDIRQLELGTWGSLSEIPEVESEMPVQPK